MSARPPSEWLEVAGARIEVAWHGSATARPAIVLLHEGLGCVAAWRDFPAALSMATGLSVFAYSRAGYGGSSGVALPRPLTYMHDEAATLPRLLEAARIDDAILFGHSDGASIAVIYAGSDPKGVRLRSLVLEAPHVFCEDVSVASIAAAREAFVRGDLRARLARYHGANTDGAFWGWNDAWLDPAFRAWNIEEFLPRVHVPALVVQSPRDPYGTLAQVEAIERGSSGAVARALLGDGHAPHKEAPRAVLDAVVAFVARSGCD